MADYPIQGEIWWTSFYEGGEHPSIVVSINELNRGRLVLVVPCTSSRVQERAAYPNHVLIPSGTGELTKDTIAQTHLLQPIEVSFLERKIELPLLSGHGPCAYYSHLVLPSCMRHDQFMIKS